MIRINLLPHREQKRKERRTQFYVLALLMVGVGAAIGYVVHTMIASQIQQQEARNAVIKSDIAKLDKEITEIRNLQQQIDDLLSRKQVIESLQGNRAEIVHLLNQLVLGMPEGVYLKTIKQTGTVVKLGGLAQSNSRVSHLMRNLDQSPFLTSPKLIEVKSVTVNNRRLSEFVLDISIARPSAEEMEGRGK